MGWQAGASAKALHEPPQVPLGIQSAVGAVRPEVWPVVVGLWFQNDLGSRGDGAGVVRVHVVRVEGEGVRHAACRAGALLQLLPRLLLPASRAEHDDGIPVDELGVLESSVGDYFLTYLEGERLAEPVQGGQWIFVVHAGAHSRPAGWRGLHGNSGV